MSNRTGVIYQATSPSGKSYIGQSLHFEFRKKEHARVSFYKPSKEYDLAFHAAIRKYGFEKIKWKILESEIPENLLTIKECEWIFGLKTFKKRLQRNYWSVKVEFPQKKSVEKRQKDLRVCQNQKNLLRKSIKPNVNVGWFLPENNPMYGRKRPDMSLLLKGKPLSEERKQKMSEQRKGKYCGENNPMYGKTHTPEIKALLAKLATGRPAWNKRKVRCLETGQIFDSVTEAAKHFDGSRPNLTTLLNGTRKAKKFKGHTFEYVEEEHE